MRVVDFLLRLVFFATVPFLATVVATLFPMTGVLANVALTLLVFAFAEALREKAGKSKLLHRIMARRFAYEAFYRENPPRPFLFYVFYPLLLPYVVARPIPRKELLLYRGFTGGGIAVLVAGAAFDFYRHWLPELAFKQFLQVWVMLFAVQTLAIFVFLLPISTTVVKFHSERRLKELWVLFGAAALSVSVAVAALVHKKGHVVSWVTGHRAMLRTTAVPDQARASQLQALREVQDNYAELVASTDSAGWVEGDSGQRAEDELGLFYKPDEAYAFSLHAFPPTSPEVLLLQCWVVGGHAPIWRAIRKDGTEITDKKELPPGILGLKPHKEKKPGTRPKGQKATKGSASATPRPATTARPGTPSAQKKK